MKKLTGEQRGLVRNFLTDQGLTFDPLLEEMIDHVSSDIEERMEQDIPFEEALRQAKHEIPENHIRTIQYETMETINKRFTISRMLSILAIALMFAGTTFKVLHLAGASQILLLSFVAMSGAFLSATVSGIYIHKKKQGAARVLSIVAGSLLLLVGYSFRLWHLQGADVIVAGGVGLSLIALLFNTLYIFRNNSGEANLLTFLHEKYTPGIERFFLILLVPTGLLKLLTLPVPPNVFIGSIILIITIYGAGLQFYALIWRSLEKDNSKRSIAVLTAIILSFTSFNLVFLGNLLPFELRLMLIILFSLATAWLTYYISEPGNIFVRFVVWMVPVIFTANTLLRLHVLPESLAPVVFNIIVTLFLTAGIFISNKHEATRTFLILSLASYLLEYTTILPQ